ncbi:MAG: hypothetical protein ACOYCA_05835 [Eggerthellaceae bacterium]|jgi:hypothetical protein
MQKFYQAHNSSYTGDMSADQDRKLSLPLWATRIAFAAVFIVNLQCAISFITFPENFLAAYDLSGAPVGGVAAIQGFGIVFLMWNATYPAYIAKPLRFSVLGIIVLVQQAIGVVGETALLLSLPVHQTLLEQSIERFAIFDALGFVLMLAAFLWLTHAKRRNRALDLANAAGD